MTDASHSHATETEARDIAEAARESEWQYPSFVRELFLGRFRLDLIHPHPERHDPDEAARAATFLTALRDVLARVDSDEIDRTGELPEPLVESLRAIGAFGIKIPREYGGLGLSQMTYIRAIEMVTSKDGSLTALLSASQSIGVPQPLALFGTEEQKQRFFPRLAKWRHQRVRAHRGERRLRSRQHGDHRDPVGRRHALRDQWGEALVHQRNAGGVVRRDGTHAGPSCCPTERRGDRSRRSSWTPPRPASRCDTGAASWDSRRSRTG